MKLIDKLLMDIKAPTERLKLALIEPGESGGYIASCHLWTGKPGENGREVKITSPTEDASIQAVQELGKQYPGDYTIIIDDLPRETINEDVHHDQA